MKAQTLVFEQVLLFAISVAIFIVCLALFQLYQMHFTSVALNDQVKAVKELVSAQVLEIAKFEELDGFVELKIPKTVGGESYFVLFTGTGINITTLETRTTTASDFYRLGNRYTFIGNSTSAKGEIIIYKRGYNIILE